METEVSRAIRKSMRNVMERNAASLDSFNHQTQHLMYCLACEGWLQGYFMGRAEARKEAAELRAAETEARREASEG